MKRNMNALLIGTSFWMFTAALDLMLEWELRPKDMVLVGLTYWMFAEAIDWRDDQRELEEEETNDDSA